MRRVAASIVLAGFLGVAACGPAPSAAPGTPAGPTPTATIAGPPIAPGVDRILRGGNILTLDPAAPAAQAVAIAGDRIVAVGTDAEIGALAGAATVTIDLGGLTVVPGFIDAHEHRIGDGPRVVGRSAAELVREAVEQGYTTIDELYVDEGRLDELVGMDTAGELPLRVNAYLPVNENGPEGNVFGPYWDTFQPGEQRSPHVRVAGLKVFTDYDNATILLWEQAALDAFVLDRAREGWQLGIKTVSTRSLEMILAAVAAAREADPSIDVAATRLEHMLFAMPAQIDAMAELGIVPVINLNVPGQVVDDPSVQPLIDGEPDGSYAPWRSLFDAGIESAGMSGYPSYYVDEPTGAPFGSPIHMIWQAVTRAGNLGVRPPDELLGEAITAEQALRSLTINAAIASGEGDAKGSLEAGKLADLVALSGDPLAVDAEAINDIRTLITLVGGEIAWCAPETQAMCEGSGPAPTQGAPATPAATATGGIVATASRSQSDSPPSLAVDGDTETAWISGDDVEQWLQLELPAAQAIETVHALVAQTPAGQTTHELWVGASADELVLADTVSGVTEDGQELAFEVPGSVGEVRVLRIVTTVSPSWVAWREVWLTPPS
jgi:predicted amidohydrolase YtcJ